MPFFKKSIKVYKLLIFMKCMELKEEEVYFSGKFVELIINNKRIKMDSSKNS